MTRVKFFSETDLAYSSELPKIITIINTDAINSILDLADVIEFYNIIKYMQVKKFADFLEDQAGVTCKNYIKLIKANIGKYLSISKSDIISKFISNSFIYTEDFLGLIEEYGTYSEIHTTDFELFLGMKHVPLYMVLKYKKIVNHFDVVIKDKIMSEPTNIRPILSKYLGDKNIYIPKLITNEDIINLLENYLEIDSSTINVNILREIVYFPPGTGLDIPDRIKLRAKRKEKEASEKIFINGTVFESSVSISYEKGMIDEVKIESNGRETLISLSRDWIEENTDYPTLWNNFIYLLGLIGTRGLLNVVSKKNEIGTIESVFFSNPGSHMYNTSFTFQAKEMCFDAMIFAYIQALSALNIRIETMIEWFFSDYLKDEFSIDNFIVKMPTKLSTYFEKCRTILPEIDRILKQFNVLVEDGVIDQELIQISSSSVKFKDVQSLIPHKYVYPTGNWFHTATYLLFSDQSGIFYVSTIDTHYNNFFNLIMHEKIKKEDFEAYQIHRIDWLLENNIIYISTEGFISVSDIESIYILKELYTEDVLSYYHYETNLRNTIDLLEKKKIVVFESSLLTSNEHDYLDYYLNKSKFTNGLDLRNRYLHGTNQNNEEQYKYDYYKILKLIILIILKINDDLSLNDALISTGYLK